MASISWPQVLAWRLRRHLLDPIGTESVEDVVRRLGAVHAPVAASAELAIRLRRQRSEPDEVTQALAEGRLIKAWIMRGSMHLLTPEDGGAYLGLMAANRQWELPSWQSFYGLTPEDWEPFRAAVGEALAEGPLSASELGARVIARPKFAHLGFAFAEHSSTILKPLFWQGVMSFGPPREGRHTFQLLSGNPRWAGVPEPEEAGPRVVEAHLRAYGPATIEQVRYWTGAGQRKVQAWLASLGTRVVTVQIDGERRSVLREDLDDLASTSATPAVRLLPGNDQWVMGPGTAESHIVPPARRSLISRRTPFVIMGGVVSGTWAVKEDRVVVVPFAEAEPLPRGVLAEEVARLATILRRPLGLTIAIPR